MSEQKQPQVDSNTMLGILKTNPQAKKYRVAQHDDSLTVFSNTEGKAAQIIYATDNDEDDDYSFGPDQHRRMTNLLRWFWESRINIAVAQDMTGLVVLAGGFAHSLRIHNLARPTSHEQYQSMSLRGLESAHRLMADFGYSPECQYPEPYEIANPDVAIPERILNILRMVHGDDEAAIRAEHRARLVSIFEEVKDQDPRGGWDDLDKRACAAISSAIEHTTGQDVGIKIMEMP